MKYSLTLTWSKALARNFAICTMACALMHSSFSKEKDRVSYTCPRYNGSLSFGNEVIGTQFYVETSPIGRLATPHVTATQSFRYVDCSESSFLCLGKVEKDEWPLGGGRPMPIVLPTDVTPGRTYEFRGMYIESHYVFRGLGENAARLLIRRSEGGSTQEWYALTVIGGRGIVEMHFSSIHTWSSTAAQSLEVKDVTCVLNSKRGLFPGVKVQRVDPSRY